MNENERIEIGERLKALRQSHKLSQRRVAELIGITESSYSKIENGHSQMSIDVLMKLAEVLNTSMDYLIRGKFYKGRSSNNQQGVIENCLKVLIVVSDDLNNWVEDLFRII